MFPQTIRATENFIENWDLKKVRNRDNCFIFWQLKFVMGTKNCQFGQYEFWMDKHIMIYI